MKDARHTHDSPNGGGSGTDLKIGHFLERTRKERGLSLEEVEQATKIRKRYLTGLEREDYAVLPDEVYAQGFLKTYANYLGLDGEALSRQLRSARKPRRERGIDFNSPPLSDFERPLITPGGVKGTEKRNISPSAVVTLLVALLALATVMGTLYFVGRGVLLSRSQEPDAPKTSSEQRHQAQPKVASKAPSEARPVSESKPRSQDAAEQKRPVAAKQGAPPETLQVLVNVRDRPAWLLVQADGVQAYEQVAQPGFSRTFQAKRQIYIRSGDAGAVWVRINGQNVGVMGEPGAVVDENYTLKSAS